MSDDASYRPLVLAPTYNNAGTIAQVLKQVDRIGLDTMVVNDGATDETPAILGQWMRGAGAGKRIVVTHPANRGKAAALWAGFTDALARGYTHAITIDTDGQLDPAEIPGLLRQSQKHPEMLIIGCRDLTAADYPRGSRVGRRISNFMSRVQSGVSVGDSQCGFRVYPLKSISRLRCHWGRYGFETEVLTRAGWAGIPVGQQAVKCVYDMPAGRVSHFKPWLDSVLAVFMHMELTVRSLIPFPARRLGKAPTGIFWRRFGRWISPLRAWRAVRDDPAERRRFPAALASGAFVGNLPLYGMHTPLALLVARSARLNPLATVAGTHIALPPLGPLLIAASITIGHVMVHGTLPRLASYDPRVVGYWNLLRRVMIEWSLGSIVCGAVCAAIVWTIAYVLMRQLAPVAPAPHTPAAKASDPAARAQVLDHAVAE